MTLLWHLHTYFLYFLRMYFSRNTSMSLCTMIVNGMPVMNFPKQEHWTTTNDFIFIFFKMDFKKKFLLILFNFNIFSYYMFTPHKIDKIAIHLPSQLILKLLKRWDSVQILNLILHLIRCYTWHLLRKTPNIFFNFFFKLYSLMHNCIAIQTASRWFLS